MSGKTWKKIQRMAYPFFIGIYVHIMVLYSADVKSHITGIVVYNIDIRKLRSTKAQKGSAKEQKAQGGYSINTIAFIVYT